MELHGTMRSELWKGIERELDDIQRNIFYDGKVRSWICCKTQVFMPYFDEDVFYVFSHILHHYFRGGIGLRQVCDWCRLLWAYRDSVNLFLLESRLKKAGMMTEWKTFAALAVNALGMPYEAMPFYENSYKWQRKAERVLTFIMETGNFGHNRDLSFRQEQSAIKRKVQIFLYITGDSVRHFRNFPLDSIKVWWCMMKKGLNSLVR